MIDLLRFRYLYLLISGLIIVPGIVFMLLGGLKPGIDYTGGTEVTIVLPLGVNVTSQQVSAVVQKVPYTKQGALLDDVEVQGQSDPAYPGQQEYLVRTRDIGSNQLAQDNLITALVKAYGKNTKEVELNTVSSSVGQDTASRATTAVIIAAIAILLYMAYAFRNLKHPFVYGAAALAALMHDVLVVLGLFAVLGFFFNVRIDALFVPAVLTVIGFSVHDTIVVFDRIRENISRRTGEPYYRVVNNSLAQTLGRSLNTSITVLLTLSALLLFGGTSIRIFVLALFIGILSGTYSSIFNATPLAVMWETGEFDRFLRIFKRNKPSAGARPTRPAASSAR